MTNNYRRNYFKATNIRRRQFMLRKLVLEFPEELSEEDLHDKEVVIKGKG